MIFALHLAATLAACLWVLWIAWVDFKTLTISNNSVLVMLGLAVIVSLTRQPPDIMWDLGLGLALFLIGFLFWLVKAMGAGDVKLYFPLGVALGLKAASVYVVVLMVVSFLFLVAAKLAARSSAEGGIVGRLAELGRGRGLPYAVPMSLSFVMAVGLMQWLAIR